MAPAQAWRPGLRALVCWALLGLAGQVALAPLTRVTGWPLLKPGGRLLYATCSIFRAEGQQQIDAFLQRHAPQGARLHPASPGHLLGVPDNPPTAPGLAQGDGFYLALITKP